MGKIGHRELNFRRVRNIKPQLHKRELCPGEPFYETFSIHLKIKDLFNTQFFFSKLFQ